MTNIHANVTGAKINLKVSGPLTSGMVGVPVTFTFNEAWDGLTKTAVFKVGGLSIDQVCIETEATVPWEALETDGSVLFIGVYGCNADGTMVIPTVWAEAGRIRPGADPAGAESADPTLPIWQQLQNDNKRQDEKLAELEEAIENGGNVPSGGNVDLSNYPTKGEMEEAIEEAVKDIPQGGGGTTNHAELTNRDLPDQHPMSAITGLEKALANIPSGGGGEWITLADVTLTEEVKQLEFDTSVIIGKAVFFRMRYDLVGAASQAAAGTLRVAFVKPGDRYGANLVDDDKAVGGVPAANGTRYGYAELLIQSTKAEQQPLMVCECRYTAASDSGTEGVITNGKADYMRAVRFLASTMFGVGSKFKLEYRLI